MRYVLLNVFSESVDDCGLRYMLAMRRYTYLLRMLPLRQRAQLNTQGLNPAEITWAFHSESQEVQLTFVDLCYHALGTVNIK